MDSIDDHRRAFRVSSRTLLLGAILLAALGLALAPAGPTGRLRGAWREALRPTLGVLETGGRWFSTHWNRWRHGGKARLVEAQQQVEMLSAEVERLMVEVQFERRNRAGDADPDQSVPTLLVAQTVPARVLGSNAKAFLRAHDLLDVGQSRGAAVDALVIDEAAADPALIDQGTDATVQSGHLVLAGTRIWGKVADVGEHTSTVRRLTDPGYRDLVQLAGMNRGRLQFTTRGVLVGRGERLCKIELVETTQPVSVGDMVLTADDGVLDVPLVYGRVVRLDRKPGSAHWEIWMQPAVDGAQQPTRVAVLRLELNPARVAAVAEP